ncbi:outer-membrane lipoprotein carrier protein LolA [bacterium]|nr:outer-membrane lipoprotein carrier protein LolA [bacterium]
MRGIIQAWLNYYEGRAIFQRGNDIWINAKPRNPELALALLLEAQTRYQLSEKLVKGKDPRWEIGKPVRQTIVYNGGQVLMIDELKKTGERLSPDDRSVKPLFLTLGMGKEASFDEMLKVFTITSTNEAKGRYNATFSPKQRSVKKLIKSLLMQVNLEASFVERIGWTQRDGTETMTEFFTPQLNIAIPSGIFNVNDSAYRWKK